MKSVNRAIDAINETYKGDDRRLKEILLQFYKDRSIEIICHLDAQELVVDKILGCEGTAD